jgi:hypothetical protein
MVVLGAVVAVGVSFAIEMAPLHADGEESPTSGECASVEVPQGAALESRVSLYRNEVSTTVYSDQGEVLSWVLSDLDADGCADGSTLKWEIDRAVDSARRHLESRCKWFEQRMVDGVFVGQTSLDPNVARARPPLNWEAMRGALEEECAPGWR